MLHAPCTPCSGQSAGACYRRWHLLVEIMTRGQFFVKFREDARSDTTNNAVEAMTYYEELLRKVAE